jgi:GNAT superfamily N-acetyltransferase
MNKLLSKLNKKEYQRKWYLDNKEKINNKHKKAYESTANARRIKKLQEEINQLDKEGKIINSLIQKKMYERHEQLNITPLQFSKLIGITTQRMKKEEVMKERAKPKIFLEREITNIYSKPKRQWQDIGRIYLIDYCTSKDSISHIEFELNEEWRNQGIMSKELPKYLKFCKKYGHNRLIALVKEGNIASIKLLEKNGFLKFRKIDDTISYIIHLDIRYSKMLEKITD